MKPLSVQWQETLLENWQFKVISLVIALILWATVSGRRDFVFTKVIAVEFLTTKGHLVMAQTSDRIRVRVSGPRNSLKAFMDSQNSQNLQIDISQLGVGIFDVDIPLSKIELPIGVKILGVRPNVIRIEVASDSRR